MAGSRRGRWRRAVEGLWWSDRQTGTAALLSHLASWSLFVTAFVFVDWATYEFALAGLSIRPWNPAAGLAFAMLALRGLAAAPWYLAAFLLAELVVRDVITSWTGAIGVGLIKAAVYAIAAIMLTGRFGVDLALARLRDIAVFLVAGSFAAIVAAMSSVTYLDALGIIPPQRFEDAVLRLAVGDALGITVFGLLTVRLVSRRTDWLTSTWFGTRSEAVVTFLVLASVVWLIFGVEETDEFKFFYLLFVPIVIASLRHGLDGSILILALTQIAKFAIMQYRDVPAAKVVDLQYLMLVLTVTTLLIGTVVGERRRLQAEATANERRLRQRDEALARSARLDLLGTMTSSLVHNVNQPLTSARAQARAAERMLAQTTPRRSTRSVAHSAPRSPRSISRPGSSPGCASICTARRAPSSVPIWTRQRTRSSKSSATRPPPPPSRSTTIARPICPRPGSTRCSTSRSSSTSSPTPSRPSRPRAGAAAGSSSRSRARQAPTRPRCRSRTTAPASPRPSSPSCSRRSRPDGARASVSVLRSRARSSKLPVERSGSRITGPDRSG
ncbi:MAG: hypothetical protein FJX67_13150 [Alphaproteobacteria bacterium]|nr:hypothetical protein [Alphaproteobacteria bacterium]